ncbi:unnamed protein product, partial [Porites lobata]
MAEKELKWYNILKVLFGTILSIADPITDVLTLVEFYRTDHKTWFGVGLTFIILPSLFFLLINYVLRLMSDASGRIWGSNDHEESKFEACKFTHVLVLGCNPLYPAWLKLRTLYCYLKKLLKRRQGNNTHQMYGGYSEEEEELDDLLRFSELGVLAEAALESAPQFIIQLYAMAVQQQSVSIIQMVSLPVSFLSLAWASTVADKTGTLPGNYRRHPYFGVKDTVLLFVTHLFILSSRLFAVALFTVSYKWWVISVLILHCTMITICDRVWLCRGISVHTIDDDRFMPILFFCFHWLRDDLSIIGFYGENRRLTMKLISNVLFVIENLTMILLFYFSHFPHTWYSLPVTICVCLFAVLGAVMRLTHFYYSQRRNQSESSSGYSIERP